MKHLKMLGAALVTASALMAFVGAGTASATGGVACSTATDPCTSPWSVPMATVWSLQGSVNLEDTNGNTFFTCAESTIEDNFTSNSSGGETTGSNTKIGWGSCTATTDTTKLGKVRITATTGGNGILIADEEIKWTTNIFGSCEFGVTAGTRLGTITEGKGTGVVIHTEAIVQRLSGFLCPSTERMTDTYVLTSPSNTTLYVSKS